jgi:DNA invertase Pin-like site-specific DNA recombinase
MHKAIIFVHLLNKKQDYYQQLEDLRTIAKQQEVQVVAEIIDKAKRGLPNQQREGLQQLLGLCRQGGIQKLLVSELAHLVSSRVEFAQLCSELAQLGTSIYMHDLGFETFKSGQPNPLILKRSEQLIEKARLDQVKLRERSLASIEKRRQGKTTGRLLGTIEKRTAFLAKYPCVIQQLKQGAGVRETARLCQVSTTTVSKVKDLL